MLKIEVNMSLKTMGRKTRQPRESINLSAFLAGMFFIRGELKQQQQFLDFPGVRLRALAKK